MFKYYKFRIYPTQDQQIMFLKTFGCCRFIYNRMLADKIAHYELTNTMLYCYPSQYKQEFPWLNEIDSLALVGANNNLNEAFSNFFRNPAHFGFPKFKRKHSNYKSYTTYMCNDNIRLENGYLSLPKIKFVRIKQHRQIPDGYKLKHVTVSQTPTGKYYASILYEYEENIQPVYPTNVVGLDFSMQDLYVASDGARGGNPKYYRKAQDKLAKEQRKLSRRKHGSKNYEKQRLKVARIHEHIANQRKDFLHKTSRQITNVYDAICIEKLDMQEMSQHLKLGKSVYDNGWGMFKVFIKYKLAEQGKQLVIVDKWFPSSKKCSQCGKIKDDLELSERIYICECGLTIDRDLNAAINIKNEGMRMLLT